MPDPNQKLEDVPYSYKHRSIAAVILKEFPLIYSMTWTRCPGTTLKKETQIGKYGKEDQIWFCNTFTATYKPSTDLVSKIQVLDVASFYQILLPDF